MAAVGSSEPQAGEARQAARARPVIAGLCAGLLVPFRTMPFPIDVSHPFRYPSELRRLVEAVRRAGDMTRRAGSSGSGLSI
jgi:hypothetical protein